MLFLGLVRLDSDQNPCLELAESYQASEDFKTYAFKLKDCLWSNGSPITAYDYEHTWKAALTPAYTSSCTNLLFHLKNGRKAFQGQISIDHVGVKAIDAKTLVVELEDSNPHFLNILAHSIFSPVHETMRYSPPNISNLVCSGPFLLKHYVPQDKIILTRNKRYWNSAHVALDELHYFIVKELATALFMFEKKELDWLGYPLTRVPPESIPSLQAQGVLRTCPSAAIQWLFINTDRLPLNNPNIRKALAYSIDRQAIIKEILHLDEITPALGLIPKITKKEKWHPWFKDNDIEQAQLLFEKGLHELNISKKDFPALKISYAVNQNSKILQVIQQMWKKNLGIEVSFDFIEAPTLFSKWYSHDYDMVFLGWVIQYNDPTNMMEIFQYKDMEPNYTGWEHPEFIRHTLASIHASNENQRWEHIDEAERIFFNEMPSLPLYDHVSTYIEHPYVKGAHPSPLHHIDFDKVSIEKIPHAR